MKNWRTQDWFWLIAFLVYAQGFTVLYRDMVMVVFSYVSTFTGIALAGVAIYISIREATKGDIVKDQINTVLGTMHEKLAQMDTKLNRLDPKLIEEIDESSEKTTEDIVNKIQQKEDPTSDEIIEIIKDEISKANKDLKSSLTVRSSAQYPNLSDWKSYYAIQHQHHTSKDTKSYYFNKAIASFGDLPFTVNEIDDEVAKSIEPLGLTYVKNRLDSLVRLGYLSLEDNSYKRLEKN